MAIGGGYLAVWLAAFGLGWLGAATADDDLEWEDLSRAIIGLFAGLIVGHVIWLLATAKLLGRYRRTGRTVVTILGTPAAVVAYAAATARVQPFGIFTLAIPWVFAWWATATPHPAPVATDE